MNERSRIAADVISAEVTTKRTAFFGENEETMTDAVKELDQELAQVAEGMLEVALGEDGLNEEIDALLAAFDEPKQQQVVQIEVDGWAVELFRARLQGAGGQDVSKSVEEIEGNIKAFEELYGVKLRPLAPELKAELKRQAIERFRVDYQRLSTRAKVQLKNGNQAGLKATEEAQERIRETVRGMALVE